MPCRVSSHEEIDVVITFKYLNVFKLNEHTQDYHSRKPNGENFLFEIEVNNYIYAGDKVVSFETNDKTIKYSSKLSYNDVIYPYAYGEENIYFMLHQKYITIQEYESSTEKDEYQYLSKKDGELKGDNITDENEGIVEYGNGSRQNRNCRKIVNKNHFQCSSPKFFFI